MAEDQTSIHLIPEFFSQQERLLVEHGPLSTSTFRYSTGVCALRLRNERGELVLLPFQGQQIWSAQFDRRNLTMKSAFDEPLPTQDYLGTYGGFMLHCGATAMGVPAQGDNHPLHGELPNAPYRKAHIVLGEDKAGPYIGLGGEYRHTVAFTHDYVVRPLVTLHAGAGHCYIGLTVTNLKHTPMEFMYMAHINFRPVDNGWLVYSAFCSPAHVRVRKSVPAHAALSAGPGYADFLNELERHPEQHHILRPDLPLDPEIVFMITYEADAEGWAHTMQLLPDGTADYVRHRPAQLDHGVRWMMRSGAQEALGMVLPATAGPEGYTAEKAQGNLKVIPPGGSYTCDIEAGVLTAEEAQAMTAHIERIMSAD